MNSTVSTKLPFFSSQRGQQSIREISHPKFMESTHNQLNIDSELQKTNFNTSQTAAFTERTHIASHTQGKVSSRDGSLLVKRRAQNAYRLKNKGMRSKLIVDKFIFNDERPTISTFKTTNNFGTGSKTSINFYNTHFQTNNLTKDDIMNRKPKKEIEISRKFNTKSSKPLYFKNRGKTYSMRSLHRNKEVKISSKGDKQRLKSMVKKTSFKLNNLKRIEKE